MVDTNKGKRTHQYTITNFSTSWSVWENIQLTSRTLPVFKAPHHSKCFAVLRLQCCYNAKPTIQVKVALQSLQNCIQQRATGASESNKLEPIVQSNNPSNICLCVYIVSICYSAYFVGFLCHPCDELLIHSGRTLPPAWWKAQQPRAVIDNVWTSAALFHQRLQVFSTYHFDLKRRVCVGNVISDLHTVSLFLMIWLHQSRPIFFSSLFLLQFLFLFNKTVSTTNTKCTQQVLHER